MYTVTVTVNYMRNFKFRFQKGKIFLKIPVFSFCKMNYGNNETETRFSSGKMPLYGQKWEKVPETNML